MPRSGRAHAVASSYLELELAPERAHGQLRAARSDLDVVVGLDRDADGRADDAEIEEARAAVEAYVLPRLELTNASGRCPLVASALRPDGAYVVLEFASDCEQASALRYDLFFEHDRSHQAYLRVRGSSQLEHVFQSSRRGVELTAQGPLAAFLQYLAQGIEHILIGVDHVLFLLTLLLGAVLKRGQRAAAPAPGARAAWLGIARVVTAFTVAHSLTLSVTALGVVAPSARWVECAIAASIVAAAANNLWPIITRRLWLLALAFGFVHGFGFAGALSELGLPARQRLAALLGFNLGVELGQLALVGVCFPVLLWLRRHQRPASVTLSWGSALIGVVGAFWAVQRALVPSSSDGRVPAVSASAPSTEPNAAACRAMPVLAEPALARIWRDAGDPKLRAGLELACAGQLEQAARALGSSESSGTAALALAAQLRLAAEIEDARGERERAATLLARAAGEWRTLGAKRELADTLARAGDLAARDERWADVFRAYQEARALHEQAGDASDVARDDARLGDVLVSAADTRGARRHYERARAAYEKLSDRANVAAQYRNLAIVARLDADPTGAAQMYRRAIELNRQLGNQPELGADLAALARVHVDLGEHEQAESLYRQAIVIEAELGRPRFLARAHNQLGNLYQRRGDLARAESAYREAVELGAGDPIEAANAWANLAGLEQQRSRLDAARSMYQQSLALFERGGAPSKVYRVRALLASLDAPRAGP